MNRITKHYKKREKIPFMVKNPMLEINENTTNNAAEKFFVQLFEAAEENFLNESFDEGYHYIIDKYHDHKQLDDIVFNYYKESFDAIHAIDPMDEDSDDDDDVQTIDFPFFIAVNVNKAESKNVWKHIEGLLSTSLDKEGYEFKMLPRLFSINELEDLKCDGLFEIKNEIIHSPKKLSIYTQAPTAIQLDKNNYYTQGLVFGALKISQKYFRSNQEDGIFKPIIDNYQEQLGDINSKNINLIPNIEYIDSIKALFFYQCRTLFTKLLNEEIQSLEVDAVESRIEGNQCKVLVTSEDEIYSFSFYWPEVFMPVLDTCFPEFADEILNIESIIKQQHFMKQEHEEQQAIQKRRLLAVEDDATMNKVIDKTLVNQELLSIMQKYK